jgi:queuine/archaeosine tRNA-ribosyltransferase
MKTTTGQIYTWCQTRPSLRDRGKMIAVVHGRTWAEVEACTSAAIKCGFGMLGFGAFGTSGANSTVNFLSAASSTLLARFVFFARSRKIPVHVFGIGNPSALCLLQHLGVTSSDSAGWIRTAAFGNVYMPFLGAVNITGAATSRRSIERREFKKLAAVLDHVCAFCANFSRLQDSWYYRALHNYIVTKETIERTHSMDVEGFISKMQNYNPRMVQLLKMVSDERFLQTNPIAAAAP